MYNYVKKTPDYLLYISKENEICIQDIPIQKFFNDLLKLELADLYSREKTTKKVLKFKSKVPIYIDKSTMFMCLKSYRLENSLYINYFSITSYTYINDFVMINFQNKHTMKLNKKNAFQNQMKKCLLILSYIN